MYIAASRMKDVVLVKIIESGSEKSAPVVEFTCNGKSLTACSIKKFLS